jgi:ribonuclease R
MTVDAFGNVIKSQVVKSVICSLHRMTYNKVQAILDGDKTLRKEYADILPALGLMKELAEILIKKRQNRGSIDLDIKESEIIIDSKGNISVEERKRGFSDRIIEEFMILANETVAETFSAKNIPFVYRVHDTPSEEKTLSFMQFIKDLGLANRIPSENPTPKDYAKLLDSVKDSPKYQIVNEILLRSLQKAVYHTENKGHFGLASENYCHFTSPIRRYPDLAIHRIIKSYLDGANDLEKRYGVFADESARQSSLKERSAQEAERAMDDYYKAVYMQSKIGESFNGVISGVTSFGIFVRLENTVEGLVRIDTLTGGWYEYDENTLTLKNNKFSYSIGQTVTITVVGVDYANRKPDFIINDNYYKGKRKY